MTFLFMITSGFKRGRRPRRWQTYLRLTALCNDFTIFPWYPCISPYLNHVMMWWWILSSLLHDVHENQKHITLYNNRKTSNSLALSRPGLWERLSYVLRSLDPANLARVDVARAGFLRGALLEISGHLSTFLDNNYWARGFTLYWFVGLCHIQNIRNFKNGKCPM